MDVLSSPRRPRQVPSRGIGRLLAIAIVAAMASAGCVGSGVGVPIVKEDPGAVPTTYAEIQSMLFDPLCAAQCHRGGAAPKGLSLEPSRSHRNLVGVSSTEAPALARVAPGRPDESYLVVKVVPSHPRRVGARMPRNGPPFFSSAQVRALRRWIEAGAREDWDASEEADANVVPVGVGASDSGPADADDARPDTSIDSDSGADANGDLP